MKRTVIVIVLLALVISLAGACSAKPAPTPVPTQKPAATAPTTAPVSQPTAAPKPAPTTAAATAVPKPAAPTAAPEQAKPVVLRLATFYANTHLYGKAAFAFADEAKEKSKGRLDIKIFPGGALGTFPDEFKLARDGSVDIGWGGFVPAYYAGEIPVIEALSMPFYANNAREAYAKEKQIRELLNPVYEKHNQQIINIWLFGYFVLPARVPIAKIEDLKGLLIRGPGGSADKALTLWGAKPVTLSSGDIYPALQRKTVDGSFITVSSYFGLKLNEVTNYVNLTPVVSTTIGATINKTTWGKLPDDLKQVLLDAGQVANKIVMDGQEQELQDVNKKAADAGKQITYFSPAEIEKLKEATKSLWDQYVAGTGEVGKKLADILRSK